MRDPQTARDAVVFELRRRGIRLHDVAIDAVLAVLGIPPDATTDDIRAGLYVLSRIENGGCSSWQRPDGSWTVWFEPEDGDCDGDITHGASPAAAVLAPKAKLEEQTDA